MGRTSTAPLQLQEAFINLIWEQNYSHVTIGSICEAANVKKGTFYYFFKSKTDLALAAFDHYWENESRPMLDKVFSASRSPIERLNGFLKMDFDIAAHQLKEHGHILGCPFCNVAQEVSTLEPELADRISKKISCFRSYITSTIRDAISEGLTDLPDAEETARTIYNLLHGSFAQARIQNSLNPLLLLPDSISRLSGIQLAPLQENATAA